MTTELLKSQSQKLVSPRNNLEPITSKPASPAGYCGRQIYEGSKFYWRLRLNVDYHFMYHQDTKVIEILPYDTDNQIELTRLFVNEAPIAKIIANDLNAKIAEFQKTAAAKDRFYKKTEMPVAEKQKYEHELIVQWLLNRIQPAPKPEKPIPVEPEPEPHPNSVINENDDVEDGDKKIDEDGVGAILNQLKMENEVAAEPEVVTEAVKVPRAITPVPYLQSFVLTPQLGDTVDYAEILLDQMPNQEVGKRVPKANITRRRKHTIADFNSSMESLRSDSKHLNNMCSRAQKLTALAQSSVDGFKALMGGSGIVGEKKRLALADYDKTKRKDLFRWAIVRVMLLNEVKSYTDQIESRAKKSKHTARMVGTFPLHDPQQESPRGRTGGAVVIAGNKERTVSMIEKKKRENSESLPALGVGSPKSPVDLNSKQELTPGNRERTRSRSEGTDQPDKFPSISKRVTA